MKTDTTMPTTEPTPEETIAQFTVSLVKDTHQAVADEVRARLAAHTIYAADAEALIDGIRRRHGPRLQRRKRILEEIDLAAQPNLQRPVQSCLAILESILHLLHGVGNRRPMTDQLGEAIGIANGITGTELDFSVIERNVKGLIATAIGALRPGHDAADVGRRYEEDIAKADAEFQALADLLRNAPSASTVFQVSDVEAPPDPRDRHARMGSTVGGAIRGE